MRALLFKEVRMSETTPNAKRLREIAAEAEKESQPKSLLHYKGARKPAGKSLTAHKGKKK